MAKELPLDSVLAESPAGIASTRSEGVKMGDVPQLYASTEKVKRARRKIDDLSVSISDFLSNGPIYVRSETIGNRVYIIARVEKDVPIDIGFEAVEIVQHLRSALDKMVVELVEKNSRGRSSVGFPFGGYDENEKPRPFPNERVENALKSKLTAAEWDFIVGLAPHPAGNRLLWSLNEVANADKHRSGLVRIEPSLDTDFYAGGFGFQMRDIHVGVDEDNEVIEDKQRERVLASYDPMGTNSKLNYNVNMKVAFGPGVPVEGADVIKILNRYTNQINQILDKAKTFFS